MHSPCLLLKIICHSSFGRHQLPPQGHPCTSVVPKMAQIVPLDHAMTFSDASSRWDAQARLCRHTFAYLFRPLCFSRISPYFSVCLHVSQCFSAFLRISAAWGHSFYALRHGYALCPPICALRSLAVAPSSRLNPFRIAFFPNFFFMLSMVSCMIFSRSDSASSSALCLSLAS